MCTNTLGEWRRRVAMFFSVQLTVVERDLRRLRHDDERDLGEERQQHFRFFMDNHPAKPNLIFEANFDCSQSSPSIDKLLHTLRVRLGHDGIFVVFRFVLEWNQEVIRSRTFFGQKMLPRLVTCSWWGKLETSVWSVHVIRSATHNSSRMHRLVCLMRREILRCGWANKSIPRERSWRWKVSANTQTRSRFNATQTALARAIFQGRTERYALKLFFVYTKKQHFDREQHMSHWYVKTNITAAFHFNSVFLLFSFLLDSKKKMSNKTASRSASHNSSVYQWVVNALGGALRVWRRMCLYDS